LPGIALLTSSGLFALSDRMRVRASSVAIPVLLLLAIVTVHRAHTWSSPERFATTEYMHHPRSERAVIQLLALDVAAGDTMHTAAMRRRIEELDPGALWPLAMDLSIRCSQPEVAVRWDALASGIQRNGIDNTTMKMLRQAAVNMIQGKCPHLDRGRLAALLEIAYSKAIVAGNPNQIESFGSYLGWIASSQGDAEIAARWLGRTATAAPDAVEVLFDLAYLELNRGRPDAAASAARELRRRQARHPLIGYRIDELDAQIVSARKEQAAPPPPPAANRQTTP
jgi:hypothetical protein